MIKKFCLFSFKKLLGEYTYFQFNQQKFKQQFIANNLLLQYVSKN